MTTSIQSIVFNMQILPEVLFLFLAAFWALEFASAALTEKGVETTSNFIKNTCKRSAKARDDEIASIKEGKFSDSRELNCYMACALNLMKVMKNKKLDPAGARKQLDTLMPERYKAPMIQQLEQCENIDNSDSCTLAAEFVKCSYKVNPNSMVVPV